MAKLLTKKALHLQITIVVWPRYANDYNLFLVLLPYAKITVYKVILVSIWIYLYTIHRYFFPPWKRKNNNTFDILTELAGKAASRPFSARSGSPWTLVEGPKFPKHCNEEPAERVIWPTK